MARSLLVEKLKRLSADQPLGWKQAQGLKAKFLHGSDALAVVRLGPNDTMRTACQSRREV